MLEGTAKALLNGQEYVLKKGDCLDIKVKEIHSLQNPYEETLKILEVQSGDLLSEDDIIRYEDIYGRA